MNTADVAPWLLLLAAAILLPTIVLLVAELFIGPDPSLAHPWSPAEPTPGPRRRPCLDASCRVDHDAIARRSTFR